MVQQKNITNGNININIVRIDKESVMLNPFPAELFSYPVQRINGQSNDENLGGTAAYFF